MSQLSLLFEEDLDLQDTLEDIQTITDDSSEDIIIGAMEDRGYPEEEKIHLFTNSVEQVNDDGLTPEEENEVNAAILNSDDDFSDIDDEEDF